MDPTHLMWTRIAAAVSLVLAALCAWGLIRLRARMNAASSWSKVEGEIIASSVQQPPQHMSDDLNDATPQIRYRYKVGGKDFESDQVAFGGQAMTTRVLAARMAARYPVGARVDVYADPANPAQAVLEPQRQDNWVAQFVFMLVFLTIGVVLLAHALAGKVLTAPNGLPLFAYAFPIVAFVFALAALISYVRQRQQATASLRWPTAPGTITSSSVIEEQIEEKRDDDDKSGIIRMITRYQIDLRYAYKVGGRDFVGTVAGWGWEAIYGLRDVAEKAAARYTPGQHVSVYYDPQQPAIAVLEPESRAGTRAPLVVAAVCTVIGAIILFVFTNATFS